MLEDAKKFAAERKASSLAVYFDDGTTETVKPEELDGFRNGLHNDQSKCVNLNLILWFKLSFLPL